MVQWLKMHARTKIKNRQNMMMWVHNVLTRCWFAEWVQDVENILVHY